MILFYVAESFLFNKLNNSNFVHSNLDKPRKMSDAIKNLVELGNRLKQCSEPEELVTEYPGEHLGEHPGSPLLAGKIETAEAKNPWFKKEFLNYALDALTDDMLNEQKLTQWLPGDLKPV